MKNKMINDNEVKVCAYCHSPILEDENHIKIGNCYYHYDKENKLNNCWFPEEEE